MKSPGLAIKFDFWGTDYQLAPHSGLKDVK